METGETAVWIVAALYGLVLFGLALRTGRPGRAVGLPALAGIAALAAVNLTCRWTGVFLPVNPWTVGTAAAGGLPAAVAMLLLRMVFGF